MDIVSLINTQRGCLTNELRSGTFKSTDDHWFWRASDPDKHGETYVNVFDGENNCLRQISVRKVHSILANDYFSLEHDVQMRSTCRNASCVNPEHNAIVFALTDKFHLTSKDDWTLPFGWSA